MKISFTPHSPSLSALAPGIQMPASAVAPKASPTVYTAQFPQPFWDRCWWRGSWAPLPNVSLHSFTRDDVDEARRALAAQHGHPLHIAIDGGDDAAGIDLWFRLLPDSSIAAPLHLRLSNDIELVATAIPGYPDERGTIVQISTVDIERIAGIVREIAKARPQRGHIRAPVRLLTPPSLGASLLEWIDTRSERVREELAPYYDEILRINA